MIDAIRSEWIKITTIRVAWILAAVAVGFPLLIVTLTAAFASDPPDGDDLASLLAGLTIVSALLLGVVSTLGVTSEFSHRTIRPTFAAMPDRLRPLLAKPIVQVAIAAVLTTAIVVGGWVAGSLLAEGTQALGDDSAAPALAGVVLLAIGLALLGYGLGLLIRNSAAAICVLLLWPLIAEGLIAGLLAAVGLDGATRLLPYASGINLAVTEPDPDSFGRVGGGLYFFAWVAVVVALGVWSGRRRDA